MALDVAATAPATTRTPTPPSLVGSTLDALPGVLRLGALTVAHTAGWSVAAYARTASRVLRAVIDPDEAAALSDDLSVVTGQITDFAKSVARGGPISEAMERWGLPALERTRLALEQRGRRPRQEGEEQRLRREGEALLRRSRDVWDTDSRHPAYAGILRELAPDEARILVLLLRDGPQPSVDVRLSGPVGRFKAERTIARGLTMIGSRASVRYPEAVPQYLNNLTRLGLLWQSPEPVSELLRYQVVEAQPDVLDAVHSVRSAKMIRRSIHLTPFGQDFARICFAEADELAALPSHEAPPDAATESPVSD
ncbi:Abi-alpha family protein [Nocardioides sp.]|jgi:hypothetical protein|uniref:Abi-alpha family protein n=1 Tax=Nocardioides sp. TaxID=35761 RepID=UPI002CE814A6|nr:Abi-alpha family protein [Nocardioides sp.]HVX54666.1 Abi-alpha family protein [Nocardioides sp.]